MDNNTDETVDITGKPNTETTPVGAVVERKKNNALTIALGLLVVVFAGLAIFFGLGYFNPKDNRATDSDMSSSDTNTEKQNDIVVNGLGIANEYAEVKNAMNSLLNGIEGSDGIKGGNGLIYKPDGLHAYIKTKFSLDAKIRNSETGPTNADALESKLKNAGYNSVGVIPFLGSAGPAISGFINSDGIICNVYADTDSVSQFSNKEYAILLCAKTGWFWFTDEERNLVDALETAYYNKTGDYPITMSGIDAEVKDSQIEPYQTIRIAIGGGYALFYRTAPNEKWQYFAGGQAPLECSEYNTDDLRKAFAGDVCYNGMETSKVQP